jgi:1,2-diacylglycerol 3-beta-glucosyltransferase
MTIAFTIISAVSLVVTGLICLYHIFFALIALITWSRVPRPSEECRHSFAIVIPAHNEEGAIEHTLSSCAELDYPPDKYRVYVIADNCTDQTAAIASQHASTCLVREDAQKRGKGYALEWAFPKILAEDIDAVVVLDADCRIDANALRVFDRCLIAGDQVIQSNVLASNPDDSPISCVLALATVIVNCLFYTPKSFLGLPVILIGTGMVFHRNILERNPWHAHSLCEDTEYALQMHAQRIPIHFLSHVRVVSDFPANGRQFTIQRRRWIAGGLGLGWTKGIKLIWIGLTSGKARVADAGFTSLVVSRPLVITQLIFSGILVFLCAWTIPTPASEILRTIFWTIIGLYIFYVLLGMYFLGLTVRRAFLLLGSPVVILRYLVLTLTTTLLSRPRTWDRTPRTEESPQTQPDVLP